MFVRQWRYMKGLSVKKKEKKRLNMYEAFELMHKVDGTSEVRKGK